MAERRRERTAEGRQGEGRMVGKEGTGGERGLSPAVCPPRAAYGGLAGGRREALGRRGAGRAGQRGWETARSSPRSGG